MEVHVLGEVERGHHSSEKVLIEAGPNDVQLRAGQRTENGRESENSDVGIR